MKTDIQPKTNIVKFKCSCGNEFEELSTLTGEVYLEICSKCHPFYTGELRLLDSEGTIDKFQRKLKKQKELKEKKAKKSKKQENTSETSQATASKTFKEILEETK
jgi:large subunit ribosomal protein L31